MVPVRVVTVCDRTDRSSLSLVISSSRVNVRSPPPSHTPPSAFITRPAGRGVELGQPHWSLPSRVGAKRFASVMWEFEKISTTLIARLEPVSMQMTFFDVVERSMILLLPSS